MTALQAITGEMATLVLTGAAADIAMLRRAPIIRKNSTDGAWSSLLVAYFDTTDLRLAASGYLLRIEESETGCAQTISRRHELKGTFGRNEVTSPALYASGPPVASGLLEFDRPVERVYDELAPRDFVKIDYWYADIYFKKALIRCQFEHLVKRAALNTSISNDQSRDQVSLIHKNGSRESFFAFARELSSRTPLQLSTNNIMLPEWRRAELQPPKKLKVALRTYDSENVALSQALTTLSAQIVSLRRKVIESRDAEMLRRLRVALRRLRVFCGVFADVRDDIRLRQLAKQARTFARLFGVARDWDVFICETLPAVETMTEVSVDLDKLKNAAERIRLEAWDNVIVALASKRFARFCIDLAEADHVAGQKLSPARFHSPPVKVFAARALDAALERVHRRVLLVDPGLQDIQLRARHRVRIALKKLRYTAQVFNSIYPKEVRKPFMTELSRLQEVLGSVNDAHVMQAIVDSVSHGAGEGAMRAAGFVSGYYDARARSVIKKLDAEWQEFEKLEPFWRT